MESLPWPRRSNPARCRANDPEGNGRRRRVSGYLIDVELYEHRVRDEPWYAMSRGSKARLYRFPQDRQLPHLKRALDMTGTATVREASRCRPAPYA
jgi:hypothetical protein